jgi:hypothetical protein
MTALNEASMKLAKLAVERHRSGRCASISQLDCILCEDFVTLHVWVYFADDTDAMFIVDLPAAIDPASFDPVGFAEALAEVSGTIH